MDHKSLEQKLRADPRRAAGRGGRTERATGSARDDTSWIKGDARRRQGQRLASPQASGRMTASTSRCPELTSSPHVYPNLADLGLWAVTHRKSRSSPPRSDDPGQAMKICVDHRHRCFRFTLRRGRSTIIGRRGVGRRRRVQLGCFDLAPPCPLWMRDGQVWIEDLGKPQRQLGQQRHRSKVASRRSGMRIRLGETELVIPDQLAAIDGTSSATKPRKRVEAVSASEAR